MLTLFTKLRVTLSSYEKLITDLEAGASKILSETPTVPLRLAVLRVGGREKPWSSIVRSLLVGEVPYRSGKPVGRLIDRIVVADGPELEQALAAIFDRKVHPEFQFATTMRQRDAIELMNIDPRRWQGIHRLLPAKTHAEHKTVNIAVALRVAAEVIDAREAKARWGVRLCRQEMIHEGLGWDRAEIERCHAKRTRLALLPTLPA